MLDAHSEAVRHNAHIPHEQFDQPLLRPLLRPFAVGAPLGTPDGAANGAGDTRLTAQDKKNGGKNGKKNGAANGNGNGAGGSANANAGGAAPRDAPAGAAVGAPSPLFPRSVYDFRAMEARPARQLVLDYGLASGDGQDEEDWDDDASTVKEEKETGKKGNTSKEDKPKPETPKQKEDREKKEAERKAAREAKLYAREVRRTEHLNDFMRFIGVSSFFSCVLFVAFPSVRTGGSRPSSGRRSAPSRRIIAGGRRCSSTSSFMSAPASTAFSLLLLACRGIALFFLVRM